MVDLEKLLVYASKLQEALRLASETFDAYADHHAIKGDAEKEKRNRDLATKMLEAIASLKNC